MAAKQVQIRGGTTAQIALGKGVLREVWFDTDKMTLVCMDGSTLGGFPLATAADLAALVLPFFALTVVEINLGSVAAYSGSFTFPLLVGPPAGSAILIQQAAGPYTGKGTLEDEAEMDQVHVTAKAMTATSATAWWTSKSGPLAGNVKFQFATSAT